MEKRARFIGQCDYPKSGTLGTAFPAGGCNEPEFSEGRDGEAVPNLEFGAWLFIPDDDPEGNAYYVNPKSDLEFLS